MSLLGNYISLCRNLLHSHYLRGRIWQVKLSFPLLKRFCHSNVPHLNQCLYLISTCTIPRIQVHLPLVLKSQGKICGEASLWGLNGVSRESRSCGCQLCCASAEHWIPSDRGTYMFFDKCICLRLWYARLYKAQGTEEWHLLWALGQYWNI